MMLSPRSVAGVTALQVLAVLPPVAVLFWLDPPGLVLVLATAAVTAVAWEMLFAGVRKRAFTAHGLTTALIVALFVPSGIAPWHVAVALSLGVVMGELIFGGRGFGFVSPSALSLSLLVVAFPDTVLRAPSADTALAVIPGLLLLLAAGLLSLRIVAGVGIGALALLAVSAQAIEPFAVLTALSIGTVFLVADPIAASTTPLGRLVYGALAGALAVVFSPALEPEALVAAALLASVFAPLIDHGAVLLHGRSGRRYRHG